MRKKLLILLSLILITHVKGQIMRSPDPGVTTRQKNMFQTTAAYDVIIDEIMADPSPPAGLPEAEFVELFNRTDQPVGLSGWTFAAGSSIYHFPDIQIPGGGYLIINKGGLMADYGTCADLFTSSTAISNNGATLTLKDPAGHVIHSVDFSSSWYRDPLKEGGGWSLEMIDTRNPCGCSENWKASTGNTGGTPGTINSVSALLPDETTPRIKSITSVSERGFDAVFTEPMDSLTLLNSGPWYFTGYERHPLSVKLVPPMYRSLHFDMPAPMQKGLIYQLSCKNPPADCAGNLMDTAFHIMTGLPDTVMPGNLLINEMLMNPVSGGVKFVEVFNSSDIIINLRDLALGSYDSTAGGSKGEKPVSESDALIFPGEYRVLTLSAEDIQNRYRCPDPDAFVIMPSFPSLDRENGAGVLIRISDRSIIDLASYSSEMYPALLTSTAGISLERLTASMSSMDVSNWHAASESCGFATPGYHNSESVEPSSGDEEINLQNPVFTPDGDGINDVLPISLKIKEPGYFANIMVYAAGGRKIKTIAANRLLAAEDILIWDGLDDQRVKAPLGIYLIYIELINPDGRVMHCKRICVLGGRR